MEQLPNAELASIAAYLVSVSKDYTAVCYRITLVSEEQLTDDGWTLRRRALTAVEAGLRAVLSLPEPN